MLGGYLIWREEGGRLCETIVCDYYLILPYVHLEMDLVVNLSWEAVGLTGPVSMQKIPPLHRVQEGLLG